MQALNKRKMIIYIIIIIFFVSIDRFIKFLAINEYFNNGVNLIGNLFKLSFVENYNIAFSLPFSGFYLNIVISLITIVLIYYFVNLLYKKVYLQAVFLSAVILGAISNLFDRLKYGYVIDYLDLEYFTVFNMADVTIVLGVVGLGWLLIGVDKNK